MSTAGYVVGTGWDAVSGFGSINGTTFATQVINYLNSTPEQPYVADPQGAIIDSNGNSWILDPGNGTNLLSIKVNGVLDTVASNAINLYKIGGRIFYQNKSYNWFMKVKPTDTWTSTSDPRIGAPTSLTTLPYTFQSWDNPGVVSWHTGVTLNNLLVTMIYRGSSWNDGTNDPQKAALSTAVTSFLSSSSADLTEFNISQNPTLQSVEIFDSTAWPASINSSYVATYLTTLFDNGTLTVPSSSNQMFMVQMPTTGRAETNATYTSNHSYFYYKGIPIVYGINIGTTNSLMTNIEFQKWVTVNQILDAALDPYPGSGFFGYGNQGGNTSFGYQEPRQYPPALLSSTYTYGYYSNLAGKVIAFDSNAVGSTVTLFLDTGDSIQLDDGSTLTLASKG